jgi:S-adenosylmethionine hydrolase
VAVVDPGVGTGREAVLAITDHAFFVAPDNGILSRALRDTPAREIIGLREERFRRGRVSSTFHGRDVFAPAAGWLCRGVNPGELGPRVRLAIGPAPPRPPRGSGVEFESRVLHVDRFGNATLDVRTEEIGEGRPVVRTATSEIGRFVSTYGDADPGEPILLIGSAGYLEIARREGRADDDPAVAVGAIVRVTLDPPAA